MISSIGLQEILNKGFEVTEHSPFLVGLSPINLFVGVNNSGKSRLLRSIFNEVNNPSLYDPNLWHEATLNNSKAQLANLISNTLASRENNNWELSLINELENKLSDFYQNPYSSYLPLHEIISIINSISEEDFIRENASISSVLPKLKIPYINLRNRIVEIIEGGSNNPSPIGRIYIPILRGLRPLQIQGGNSEENSKYIKENNLQKLKFDSLNTYSVRTKYDYFQNQSLNNRILGSIHTGLEMYLRIMSLLLGTEEQRALISRFEDFLSQHIFMEKITLIPRLGQDVLNIKIGRDPQLEIYNLGDGIQSILCILFPLFLSEEKMNLVFIEEPEYHLHPKLQRILLKGLKYFENNQYFISTHSNTFIDDEGTSIYKVEKSEGISRITYIPKRKEKSKLLRNLGYHPSDLLQANYIIWVEGPSDKIYFEFWIQQLDPTLKEGRDYSIMFYSGSTFKHMILDKPGAELSLLSSLNQRFGIIMDSDRTTEGEELKKEKARIKSIFEKEQKYCWITEKKEIENYIPNETFEKVVIELNSDKNLSFRHGSYINRLKGVYDNDSKGEISQKIRIPNALFSRILKTDNLNLDEIDHQELVDGIKKGLEESRRTTIKIDKVNFAEKVVQENPPIGNEELRNKILELIADIKKVQ